MSSSSSLNLVHLPSDVIIRCIYNQYLDYKDAINSSLTCKQLNAVVRLLSPPLNLSSDLVIKHPLEWRHSFPHAKHGIIAGEKWNDETAHLLSGMQSLIIQPNDDDQSPIPLSSFFHLINTIRYLSVKSC
jgi:hypothetical protein